MKNYLNQKVLITTQDWFYAPDGKQYRAIWGTLKGVHEAKSVLGFVPGRTHDNFFIEIGNAAIAGCRGLYCVLCPTKPDFKEVEHSMYDHTNGLKIIQRPNEIFISE